MVGGVKMKVEFENEQFIRSHGRKPSQTAFGTWWFNIWIYEERYTFQHMGTLCTAKQYARKHVKEIVRAARERCKGSRIEFSAPDKVRAEVMP